MSEVFGPRGEPIDNARGVRYTDDTQKRVVTVAQSAELWIVAPAVVGSSPIGHPFPHPSMLFHKSLVLGPPQI